jgi:hypothetical protein
MKLNLSGLLLLLLAVACETAGTRSGPSHPTSAPSGLEDVMILARGME